MKRLISQKQRVEWQVDARAGLVGEGWLGRCWSNNTKFPLDKRNKFKKSIVKHDDYS